MYRLAIVKAVEQNLPNRLAKVAGIALHIRE
ncbi:MAG: hypothetical protein ACI80F_000619 [Natronomonas sp.]|jgi:hypothetical protein